MAPREEEEVDEEGNPRTRPVEENSEGLSGQYLLIHFMKDLLFVILGVFVMVDIKAMSWVNGWCLPFQIVFGIYLVICIYLVINKGEALRHSVPITTYLDVSVPFLHGLPADDNPQHDIRGLQV